MRFFFHRKQRGGIEFGIIYGMIALLVLLAGRFLPIRGLLPSCALKALTGLPCPTCGSTRSIVHLAHADFFSAFAMNPLITILFIVAVFAFFYSAAGFFFSLPRFSIALSEREKKFSRAIALVIVCLNWLYLVLAL